MDKLIASLMATAIDASNAAAQSSGLERQQLLGLSQMLSAQAFALSSMHRKAA